MKIILILMSILVLGSCGIKADSRQETENGYDVLTIDSCQYIEVKYALGVDAGYYSLTHKGNCTNSIHYK